MPEVSRFFGIVIRMYFDDHNPPHFHAQYSGTESLFAIDPIHEMRGDLNRRRVNGDRVGSVAPTRAIAQLGAST